MTSFFSVNDSAAGYENLGSSYFLGGGGGRAGGAQPPPTAVPNSRVPSAREPGRPGQQPSSGKTQIPTSSQKPGNREGNQRIPYARMMFTDMEDAAAPRKLQSGDVVFVHKTSNAMGRGHNRPVKCTGLPQLNAMLAKSVVGVTTLGNSGNPKTDWKSVQMLADWTLDGVLINTDDEEGDGVDPRESCRNDGVLLNVCIQGPTAMRNTARQVEGANGVDDHAQKIDTRILVLDKVFAGLFSEKREGGTYGFRYRLFSGAQFMDGLQGVGSLVGAWKVGSVLDHNLTTGQERRILINVSVDWWSTSELEAAM